MSDVENDKQNTLTEVAINTANSTNVKGLTNILDALLVKKIINGDQFNEVKFESLNTGKTFDNVLLEKRYATQEQLARTYAEMQNIGFIDLKNISIPIDALQLIDANLARENLVIVFEDLKTKVKVAMKDPLDLQKVKYLESLIGKGIEAYYASEEEILRIINTKYGAQIGSEVEEALEEVIDIKAAKNYSDATLTNEEQLGAAPIIRIVNMILEYAINHKASDVHIEPRDGKISVRFRIRGVLSEKLTIPQKLLSAVVTRIKILSSLKIDEHRIPQDGRFQIKNDKEYVDIRVSIMPSIYGEKIVMRLLEKSQGIMNLEDTGMRGISLSRMKDALSKTQGIVLVTGPTGSGKTQSLASSLKILNTSEVNIITLEDPVEIRVDGVNQVQVNSEVGLTFASGLRSILRQDPDVIMVGEIRDSETAGLAVQAALVGRLVLSSIHTNSAAGAYIRLIDMGIEPFLLSSTINVIVAQRLVRVLCECKKQYSASASSLMELHKELDPLNGINIYTKDSNGSNKQLKVHFDISTQQVNLFHPVGCSKCNDSGYISRIGIFEALKNSDQIANLVMKRSSINEIHNQSVKEGMMTMIQDGFIKALEGITTVEEVLRVRNE